LNHVAQRAGGFVESPAAFDAERFTSGDLNVVDVVAVPERFEDAITEAKDEKILDCVFTEIVIDTVDLALFENTLHFLVQLFGGGKVAAKWLFDDDAHPGVFIRGPGKPGLAKLLDDVWINFRRRFFSASSSARRLARAA